MPSSRNIVKFAIVICCGFLVWSCSDFFNGKEDREVLARVGDTYLYEDAISSAISDEMSPQDSAAFVVNFINQWASKQLLLSKSKINLPDEKLAEFDRLVADYQADLYTKAYLEALVQKAQDTLVSQEELGQFYKSRKENFKLEEKLVQLRFAVLPLQFLNKDEVVDKFKSYAPEDKTFLDSIAVQFNKLHLNDSIWVDASRVMKEIPVINDSNQDRYLKKSQFFELQDSLGVYLGKVTNVLEVNDVAPLGYIAPNIKQIILSRRRLEQMRKLENDVLDEAIKKNEFEIYGNKE
ncbi:MAG: peptidyl-prolyl cis-trans isomerase [Bacteroidota bacterium]